MMCVNKLLLLIVTTIYKFILVVNSVEQVHHIIKINNMINSNSCVHYQIVIFQIVPIPKGPYPKGSLPNYCILLIYKSVTAKSSFTLCLNNYIQ